jgi:tripartite-type tricarboxylate transporter receptor subunit TctC
LPPQAATIMLKEPGGTPMQKLAALCIALAAALNAVSASAQNYPSKPIKIIVSTSPGGVTDLAARLLGQHITAKTGQTVVIDNRAGASGNIAMDAVAKAEPDGYTLGVANTGNIVINPYLFASMPYDPLKDLIPVGPLGTVPLFLVMNSNVPVKTLAEFVAYTKANPDKISYASAGAGTTPDIAAHEFGRLAGLKFVMVPFRGTAPATQAVLGGDVHATFVSMGPHIEFVKQGKLRVLAAATPKRVSYLPDTPTFAEQGFPGFETSTWFALFAPRGTPQAIVDQLNGYARGMQADADLKRRLEANFVDPAVMTAAEFAAFVKTDAAKWQRIVRDNNIKQE